MKLMGIWLNNNEKVKPKWKLLANILWYGFLILNAIRVVSGRFFADKVTFDDGLISNIILYVSCGLLLTYLLITIIYIIKPSLFFHKSLETTKET